jgi:transcriptional regulatory protein GAL4
MHVVDHFLELATSGISATQLESGSLALVQGFTLLSNLAQKRNKVNSGSVYLGLAIRMAVGLGLHRELPLWSISPFEREVR